MHSAEGAALQRRLGGGRRAARFAGARFAPLRGLGRLFAARLTSSAYSSAISSVCTSSDGDPIVISVICTRATDVGAK